MSDPVVHPSHYTSHPSGVECIQVTKHHNFCIGSAIKYLWRQGLKDGNPAVQDLRKAQTYIQFEIDRIEGIPKHAAPEEDPATAAWRKCEAVLADLAEGRAGREESINLIREASGMDPIDFGKSDEPESWDTWQDVPEGVHFTSRDYPDRPTYRRHGSSVYRLDRSWVDLTRTKLDAIAPFVRADS